MKMRFKEITADVVELVYTADLKSAADLACGFESRRWYKKEGESYEED